MELYEAKREIRKRYLKMRKALSREGVEQRSFTITRNVREIIDGSVKSILFYVPIMNEVDVLFLARDMFQDGKTILFPRLIDNEIIPYILNDLDFDFIPGAYNIPEPNTRPFEGKIDLILVPGVVFDVDGYRVGYGKGYFDRFLSRTEYELACGVAYDFQLAEQVPHGDKDHRLDMIVTSTRTIECREGK